MTDGWVGLAPAWIEQICESRSMIDGLSAASDLPTVGWASRKLNNSKRLIYAYLGLRRDEHRGKSDYPGLGKGVWRDRKECHTCMIVKRRRGDGRKGMSNDLQNRIRGWELAQAGKFPGTLRVSIERD